MKLINKIFFLTVAVIVMYSCNQKNIQKPSKKLVLKEAYKEDFYIGTAINESQILKKDSSETVLIANEFNSITAENIMKSMFIHPTKDTFNFEITDKFIDFGVKNDMFIHGHTLIWHSQLAPWFTAIKDSTEMVLAMEKHIKTIVNRYKGKIDSWDVVNEALIEDVTFRKSVFLTTIGEEYLALAFKLASEADPNTDLYYNDYNMTKPEKREGAIKLLKNLQDQGIKIDGIGIQGHWSLESPTIKEIEESILTYASIGVKVAITELDITVLPNPWDLDGADVNQNFKGDSTMNPYPENLPDSIQAKLAQRYKDIFELFLKHKDIISRVTFWGVNDGNTWLNDWPIEGRTNYPLLFDRALKPKKAFDSVIVLKENKKQN
jgi:endo-1,4-beta-xylanase